MNRWMALGALVLLTACPTNGALDQFGKYLPKLHFKKLAIDSIDFTKVDVNFVFDVDNPYPLDVKVANFDYALGFAGHKFVNGDNKRGIKLKGDGTSKLKIPLSVTFADLYNTVQAVKGEDQIPFEISGHFGFNTPLGVAKLPYDEKGDFPALRTPKFSFKNLRVKNLNLLGGTAALALDLGVENDHKSNLDFNNFDYGFSLGSRQVGSGKVDHLTSVDGAQTGDVTLPVNIDLANLASNIIDALSGKGTTVPVGLTANMDVGTPFGSVPLKVDKSASVSLK